MLKNNDFSLKIMRYIKVVMTSRLSFMTWETLVTSIFHFIHRVELSYILSHTTW
jgi:hypothetical protein